jgi:hypothetical protein
MLVVAGIGLVLFLLDQLALWAERRGWLYWRKRKPRFVGSSAVFSVAAELYQPYRACYVEEMERKRIVRQDVPSPDGPDPAGP